MEVNELRIGNYIYIFGFDYIGDTPIVDRYEREIIKVDLSVLVNIIRFDGTIDYYYTEPIPITEEILLKCGFEKKEEEIKHGINEFVTSYIWRGYEIMQDVEKKWFLCGYNWNTKHFGYLHNLQNLIYALTGQELEINL